MILHIIVFKINKREQRREKTEQKRGNENRREQTRQEKRVKETKGPA